MQDIEGNELIVGNVVLFPAGRELMRGVIRKISGGRRPQCFVENASGYKKWKYSAAVIKIAEELEGELR